MKVVINNRIANVSTCLCVIILTKLGFMRCIVSFNINGQMMHLSCSCNYQSLSYFSLESMSGLCVIDLFVMDTVLWSGPQLYKQGGGLPV